MFCALLNWSLVLPIMFICVASLWESDSFFSMTWLFENGRSQFHYTFFVSLNCRFCTNPSLSVLASTTAVVLGPLQPQPEGATDM